MGRYLEPGAAAVDAGFATPSQAIEDLVRRVAALEQRLRVSRGSPEGVIAADPGTLCEDAVNGTVYRKTGTGRTGWVALS